MTRLARSPGVADTASPADSYGFAPGDRKPAPYRYRFASSPGRWPASYRQECAEKQVLAAQGWYYIQAQDVVFQRPFLAVRTLYLGLLENQVRGER